jgi:hypothetical protein
MVWQRVATVRSEYELPRSAICTCLDLILHQKEVSKVFLHSNTAQLVKHFLL